VYSIISDKEMTSTSVEIDGLLPAREQGTVGVYREKMVDRLFSGMLNARFSDLSRQPEAPFLMAFAGRGIFLSRTKEQTSLTAMVKEDAIERGLEALVSEAERVARFGFTPAEMDRQKQSMLRNYERMLAEKENRESGSRAAEYIRNFLEQETLPTNEWEYGLHQRFLPEVTLDEVNKRAREWFPERNRLVIVNAPEKAGLTLPDQTKLEAAIKAGSTKTLTAYVDTVIDEPLLESLPASGAIASTRNVEAAGVTEWQLSNGVKVVLKPTTFREDEILFRAISPGGTSLASDDDYIAATTAAQLITAGGIGRFNAVDFRKLMTGKAASARPFIAELEEGLSGSSSRKDLELMFQLIHLAFTQPRPDQAAFGVQAAQTKTMLANQKVVPEMAFAETMSNTLSQNHLRRRITTAETVDRWNLDKSVAFYKDRFADASDFTFVFVGSFTPETMKPLVERYLGSLPSIGRKETWRDIGIRYPTGVIERTVEKGIEPKSQTAIVFTGPFQYDQAERIAIRALAQVLQSRLLETIREELGGTYSITASQSYQRHPVPVYSMSIQFGSAPDRADALVKRVFEEVDGLKTNGPTETQVNEVKQALLRDFETSSRQNAYLLSQITFKYQYGEDVTGLWQVPEYYKKLDAAAIQRAARTYLRNDNYVRVTLLPEKK
jgi:zinc protease